MPRRLEILPNGSPAPTEPDDLLRYAADPVGFATQILGVTPWERQREALEALVLHPRVTIRSAHGVGKTWLASAALLWWVYSHRPSLVLSTAPTARQVESLLWAEVNRLWRRANARGSDELRVTSDESEPEPDRSSSLVTPPASRVPGSSLPVLPGRCLNTKLEAGMDQTAQGLTTTEPERFAGWHSEHILVIVDEASGVPDSLFEVIQGTLTTAHARLLLIGNPTRADGYFALSHRLPHWHSLKISAYDTPNFRASDERKVTSDGDRSDSSLSARHPSLPCPWLVTPGWVDERKEEWGEESDPFRVRVLGEFPRASDDSLIELAWVEAAERRSDEQRVTSNESGATFPSSLVTRHFPLVTVLGVDVARFGSCETAVAARCGDTLVGLDHWRGADLMHTCGRVVRSCRDLRPERVVIDAVGLGAGLVDRLLELQREGETALQGIQIVAFSSGGRAVDSERFGSRRDEAYWELRERYREGRIAHSFSDRVPPGGRADSGASALTGQLTALRYRYSSRGQVEIESKDELRQRGLPSPDLADAVALAFAPMGGPFCLAVGMGNRRQA